MSVIGIASLIAVSYLFGAVPWGYIIGRMKGVDVRKEGSGNIGATNITRVLGKKWGAICFIIDFLKGFLPIIIFNKIIAPVFNISPNMTAFCALLIILSTVAGHMFPIYIGFKGGKGVATAAGGLAAISPLAVIVGVIAWLFVFKISGYVSLASISAAIIVPLLTTIFSISRIYHVPPPLQIMVAVLAAIVIVKHKSNIKRLINGSENRFGKKG